LSLVAIVSSSKISKKLLALSNLPSNNPCFNPSFSPFSLAFANALISSLKDFSLR